MCSDRDQRNQRARHKNTDWSSVSGPTWDGWLWFIRIALVSSRHRQNLGNCFVGKLCCAQKCARVGLRRVRQQPPQQQGLLFRQPRVPTLRVHHPTTVEVACAPPPSDGTARLSADQVAPPPAARGWQPKRHARARRRACRTACRGSARTRRVGKKFFLRVGVPRPVAPPPLMLVAATTTPS